MRIGANISGYWHFRSRELSGTTRTDSTFYETTVKTRAPALIPMRQIHAHPGLSLLSSHQEPDQSSNQSSRHRHHGGVAPAAEIEGCRFLPGGCLNPGCDSGAKRKSDEGTLSGAGVRALKNVDAGDVIQANGGTDPAEAGPKVESVRLRAHHSSRLRFTAEDWRLDSHSRSGIERPLRAP